MTATNLKFGKRFVAACAGAVLSMSAVLALPGAAQAVTPDEIRSRGSINIGIVTDQPPFSYIDAAGANKGYDIDLTGIIAKELGVSVNYVQVTSANRVSQLQTGRIDLLAMPFGIFADRAAAVRYIAPYATIVANVYGPVDDPLKEMSELAGRSIAVERGSSMDTDVTSQAPEGTDIRRYDDAASSVQALLSSQVDFLGSFSHQFAGVAAAAPGRFEPKIEVSTSYLGYVVAPQSEELAVWTGELIARLLADGTMEKLYQEHFGTAFPFPELPTEINGVTFAVSTQ